MLKEIGSVRQIQGELRRRWFTSGTMDLIVWCDETDGLHGFQLCYDRGRAERALIWMPESGFSHMPVDDGDDIGGPGFKACPILIDDDVMDADRVIDLFETQGRQLPAQVALYVGEKIQAYRS